MSLKKYFTAALGAGLLLNAAFSSAASEKPNILFIMGDDIGIYNVGAYH